MMPGARLDKMHNCTFTVWAPAHRLVELKLTFGEQERTIEMQLLGESVEDTETAGPQPELPGPGYWRLNVPDIQPGTRYFFQLDGSVTRPDPASNFQPQGVHGPSEVIDHGRFEWKDEKWKGVGIKDMIIYELHVGTFTPEGTFSAAIERLAYLKELGINAIEIMPVAQFPGDRNWGYDGVYPYAVQNSYGGPDRLKELVDVCHRNGLAVILDVVYNHLGPEGNYLRDFGPYFTDKYQTPWGEAINFDGPYSDPVREFFIENALYWFRDYHIDALRLDALHAVFDMSAKHFLRELSEKVSQFSKENGRRFYLIAESDLNDVRLIRPRSRGGYGLDAQWSDDFHHSLHALLTGEKKGYYQDFGSIRNLAKVFREGFVYTGQYSKHRKRRHGNKPKHRKAKQFVVCIQNHDQIGNRMYGRRLSQLVGFESLKLAAGTVILSPYIPHLFMGEEYGEESPFAYFVSHSDEGLIEAVRSGRRDEFKSFDWKKDIPDPQAVSTFEQSRLKWHERSVEQHAVLLKFYHRLIELRQSRPGFVSRSRMRVRCLAEKNVLVWHRTFKKSRMQCVMNFDKKEQQLKLYCPQVRWNRILDSARTIWLGPGSAVPEVVPGTQTVTAAPTSIIVFDGSENDFKDKKHRAERQISSASKVF